MIMFFHGLIGDATNFRYLEAGLKNDKVNIYNPQIDYKKYSLQELVKNTSNKLLNFTGVENNIAVGNSLGCLIALGCASEFEKIILTAPIYKFDSQFIPRNRNSIHEFVNSLSSKSVNIEEHEKDLELGFEKINNLLVDRNSVKKLKQIKKEILAFQTQEMLREYQDKIHFVIGQDDCFTPASEFSEFVDTTLPQAKINVIEDCGHAVPLEKPQQLTGIIQKYI